MSGPEIHQKRLIDRLREEVKWNFHLIVRVALRTIGIVLLPVVIFSMVFNPAFKGAVVHLVVGWFYFIRRVLPLVQVNPGLILSSLFSLGLAVWLLHRVVYGFCLKSGTNTQWTFKHTLAVTTLILVLFGSAIAGTGVGHQIAWLKREPMASYSGQDSLRLSRVGKLCILLNEWAEDHDGRYPESLKQLVPSLVDEEDAFRSFYWSPWNSQLAETLVYLGGNLTISDPDTLPLIVSPRPFVDGRYLLARKDTTARAVSPEVYQQAMADWRAHFAKLP